jgi:hypothetical protein
MGKKSRFWQFLTIFEVKKPKPFGTYLCSLERLDFHLQHAGHGLEEFSFVFE